MKNLIFFILVLSLLSGCVSQKVFRYEAEPKSVDESVVQANVVVPPFADKRANDNTDSRGISLLPLVVWSSQNFDVPEKAKWGSHDSQWWFLLGHSVTTHHAESSKVISTWNPREDIAKATADELSAANIFAKTYYGKSAKDADLILQGVINSSNYYGMFYTYGVSVLSPIFWTLGAPVTVNNNTLDLTFILKNKSGTVIWEKNYRKRGSTFSSIYYVKEDFDFYELLKDILLEVREDIRVDLSHVNPDVPKNNGVEKESLEEETFDETEEVNIDEVLKGMDVTDDEKEALGDILKDVEKEN